eukprot:TRINITY_DN2113_c0_g1_i11.p1 TRINITY_DN2113_c0_g1~~TRINITY_DN2113_c0_g1_i11.p1  ORF type:complete len:677 (-),score=211.19 TRINITY_DN2113_c0_g1_i11:116-2146(-)
MESLPIPQIFIQNLTDKSLENRKSAVRLIEKSVRDLVESRNDNVSGSVKKIIDFFVNDFINSNQINLKKAGLLALAAVSLGLISDEGIAARLIANVVAPVITCMKDPEPKVRSAACESLYNIIKALREISLLQFNEIFDALVVVHADLEEEVRKAAQSIDRLLKDVVSEASTSSKYFDVARFIPLLCDRMKALNPIIKHMLISWLNVLDSIPNINIIRYLPSFLEQLFLLIEDSNRDIKHSADGCLQEFLKEFKENRSERNEGPIIDILVRICSRRMTSFTKFNALFWLHDILKLFLDEFLASENTQRQANDYFGKFGDILEAILTCLADSEEEIRKAALKCNDLLLRLLSAVSGEPEVDFVKIVEILRKVISDNKPASLDAALTWMKHFLKNYPSKVLPLMKDVVENLIEILQDSDEAVTQKVVEVLGCVSQFEKNYDVVIEKMMSVFSSNKNLLNSKSHVIIKKLCTLIDHRMVFMTFAQKIIASDLREADVITSVINTLDYLLLTDKDLVVLRSVLKDVGHPDNRVLFETLFQAWALNPVSSITLCFLSSQYELAYKIIIDFANQEVEVETLVQVAKLVQLIDSPIFTFLRLNLLESEKHPYLLKCLYGLLMILPQGKAFSALKNRIKIIPNPPEHLSETTSAETRGEVQRLFNLYLETQNKSKRKKISQFSP